MRPLIALLLLAALPMSAKPTAITLEWKDFREMAGLVRLRSKVSVFTGEGGHKRIRGKLVRIDDAGIALSKRGGAQPFIGREDEHSVRVSPRSGTPQGWRWVAILAAYPLWYGCSLLGTVLPGSTAEGRFSDNWQMPHVLALGFGAPAGVWMLARRADKRSGAIIVRLGKETGKLQ